MGLKMKSYCRVIGIDISKNRLDLFDSTSQLDKEISYSIDAIQKKIIKNIQEPSQTLVVCEATGGLEEPLVDALHEANIDVAIANPARVRDFAKGHGFFEKSDSIDARIICLYGQQVKVTIAKRRTQEERNFVALSRRRTQLVQLISQESNRHRQCSDTQTRSLIADMLKALKDQLKSLDSTIAERLKSQAKTDPKVEIVRSVPGVGPVMTATIVADLPEIGTLSRSKIAKLVGVAPIIKQSGKTDGKRRSRGGRSSVRKILYMATLVATRKNPVIRAMYLGLIKRGKLKKVALVACMRRLLTMLNNMVRDNTKWQEHKKRVAEPAVSNQSATTRVLDRV